MTHSNSPKDDDLVPDLETTQEVPDEIEAHKKLVEEWIVLRDAPEISDEELERQALAAPGADGDPRTPE